MVQVTVVGSYPRIGDRTAEQRHRKAIEQLDKEKISWSQFEKIQDEVTKEVILEQIKLGVDLPSDGQIRWGDGISYMMRGFKGCTINGLVRYFDTNTYYRQPIIQEKLRYENPILVRDFEFAQKIAGKTPVKVILTGPYTLAHLSKDEWYQDERKLVWELAGYLNQEILALARAGVKFVEIDESAILSNPEAVSLWAKALEMATCGLSGVTVSLSLSYGSVSSSWNELLQLPVDELAIDLTAGHSNVALLHRKQVTKKICAGVVDARNTLMEKETVLIKHIKNLQETLGENLTALSPNYGLEFLPRDTARKKLKLLAAVAGKINKDRKGTHHDNRTHGTKTSSAKIKARV